MGILSQISVKSCDRLVRSAPAGRYSWAALSSNDSKNRYKTPSMTYDSNKRGNFARL